MLVFRAIPIAVLILLRDKIVALDTLGGMLPAFLTTVLFSISAVSANRMAKLLGGVEANFWRITLAMLFLGFWAHGFGGGLDGDAFPVFLLSGFIGFGIGDLALYQALPRIGSRLSTLLVHCVAAPFAAVTEWLWIGTTLTAAQIASSVTILAGVSLALAPGKHLDLSRRVFWSGIVYGIIAALGQGMGAVVSRKAYLIAESAAQEIDGLTAAYQRIIAGWVLAGVFLILVRRRASWKLVGDKSSLAKTVSGRGPLRVAAPWILVNSLSGPTLGVGCYQWALATTPTGLVLPIVAITPLVVIPFARFIEGERPSARSLLGGLIAVVGAVALTLAR
ncbi:MAG: DMT family transporter [Verrucomicrobia bacterium]|nr:DMT family transporter [Verrucomicrobiota bacterium]